MLCRFCFLEHDPDYCVALDNTRWVGYLGLNYSNHGDLLPSGKRAIVFAIDNWRPIEVKIPVKYGMCYVKLRKHLATAPDEFRRACLDFTLRAVYTNVQELPPQGAKDIMRAWRGCMPAVTANALPPETEWDTRPLRY